MESLSSINKQTALHILEKIEEAIATIQIRNQLIRSADDFLLSPEGREKMLMKYLVSSTMTFTH